MKLKLTNADWIGELDSYLKDSNIKFSKIKDVLKKADIENLSYADKYKIMSMFDPKAEITTDAFKRQLELHFSLLDSKTNPIVIPVFSEYIELIYSQDMSKIPDDMFEMMIAGLKKFKEERIPDDDSAYIYGFMEKFMQNLLPEFEKNIDEMTNKRLSALVSFFSISKKLTGKYIEKSPEIQKFIENMFIACAVKTEVSEKNTSRFRPMFRARQRDFYSMLNKAFAGYGLYETWIDMPAKRLNTAKLIDYANFQTRVLDACQTSFGFSIFQKIAGGMNLSKLPEYSEKNPNKKAYLREPRDYKDYAKKLSKVFEEMIQKEVISLIRKIKNSEITEKDISKFAVTEQMKRDVLEFIGTQSLTDLAILYTEYLIERIHLDELTGQSKQEIFENNLSEPLSIELGLPIAQNIVETEEDFSLNEFSEAEKVFLVPNFDEKRLSEMLSGYYSEYHLLSESERDSLEETILRIEEMLRDFREDEDSGEIEKAQKGEV